MLQAVRPRRASLNRLQRLVLIGSQGRGLEFAGSLIEKLSSVSRVAAHIPIVSALRGGNFVECFADVMLRPGHVRMPARIDVLRRRSLCDENSARQKSGAKNAGCYEIASIHWKILRSEDFRSPAQLQLTRICEAKG